MNMSHLKKLFFEGLQWQEEPARRAPISPVELTLLLFLVLVGFSLRMWQIESIGLDHYDEGVYVFSALGITDPGQPLRLSPEQINHSPPVFFGLVALSSLLFGGPSALAAIFVNILLGTLTVIAVWWTGRSWFDSRAGVAAAAFIALSEYHIALSRSALTDVAFAFFFILALASIVRALERQSVGAVILAGLMVGLAWNTKYHGWFALMITGAALPLFTWKQLKSGGRWTRYFFLWTMIALVGAACYLPWALYVQSQPGGYAALAQHQRTMIRFDWFGNLLQQVRMQLFVEGALTRVSIFLGIVCILAVGSVRLRLTKLSLTFLGGLVLSTLLLGGSGTAVFLVIFAIPALLSRPVPLQRWVVILWLAVWFLSAPIYHPYVRLLLPFTIASYLVCGFALSKILGQFQTGRVAVPGYLTVVIGMVVVFGLSRYLADDGDPWRPSISVANAALAMEKLIPQGSRVIVIGEPTLAYYLHLANRPAFEKTHDSTERVMELEKMQSPAFVVTGVYANRAPPLRDGLQRISDKLTLLKTYSMFPKDLRLLDDFAPHDARQYLSYPDNTYDLSLYRFSP